MRWSPSDQILQQDVMLGRLITTRVQTVVQDDDESLILYSHPRANYRSTVLRDRYSIPLTERVQRMLDIESWSMEDRQSGDYHMVSISPPNLWYSIWLFWDSAWQVRNWYVNFQSPLTRSRRGIIVEDLTLDIKVEKDFSWSMKDEDEFDEMVRLGVISPEKLAQVERAKVEAIARIESRESPFTSDWYTWRPSADWRIPQLPDDADEIG